MPPSTASTVSTSRKRGMKFIILLTVVAFVSVGWLLIHNIPSLLYDTTTEKTAKALDRWDEEKWQQVYEEVKPVFLSHLAETRNGEIVKLSESDLPPSLRGLGFDHVDATAEGVRVSRVGGDANHRGTWIHCIYRPSSERKKGRREESYPPDAATHDRKGVWLRGFREQRWTYETSAGD